jgi:hypothetical protein
MRTDGRLNRRLRVVWVLVATGIAALTLSVSAQADPKPPKPLSAISQYRESIPTASGPAFPGHTTEPTRAALPPSTARAIDARGGSDAETLKQIARSPDYGAPVTSLPPPRVRDGVPTRPAPAPVFRSSFDVITSGTSNGVIALLVVMGATLLAAGLASIKRRRTSRSAA